MEGPVVGSYNLLLMKPSASVVLALLVGCGGSTPDLRSAEPYERYLGVRELSEAPDATAMAEIVGALDDPHPLVVVGALETLADVGRKEFLQHIAPRTEHASPMVRRAAVEGLAAIRNEEGLPYVVRGVKDADPLVRRGAVRSLASFGARPEVFGALLQAFEANDAGLALVAHETLQALTGRTDVERSREAWAKVVS